MYTQCSIRYFLQWSNDHHPGYHLEVLFFLHPSRYSRVLVGVALGVGGVSPGVLSSSDELNDSHLHTGLGGVHNMFCGVTGSGIERSMFNAGNMVDSWHFS